MGLGSSRLPNWRGTIDVKANDQGLERSQAVVAGRAQRTPQASRYRSGSGAAHQKPSVLLETTKGTMKPFVQDLKEPVGGGNQRRMKTRGC